MVPSPPQLIVFAMRWYEARVHLGALDYAREHNWRLIGDEHHMGLPANLFPAGIIAEFALSRRFLRWAQRFDVPIVQVADNGFDLKIPCVLPDYMGIGRLAAEFFVEKGYKHFAYVYPQASQPAPWHIERMEGFRQGVAAFGRETHCLIRPVRDTDETGRREEQKKIRWLKSQLKKLPLPLAIFTSQDDDARFLQQVCVEMNLSIPEQVAVLGVNNDPLECPYAPVPLSSIDPDWHALGWKAAETLDRCLNGETVPPVQIIPPKGIIERQSTSIVAVEDPRVADAVFYIWEQCAENPSVDDVCDAVGVPRRTLEFLFSNHLSRGIRAEILRQRVRLIKKMLEGTDLSAIAIARQLNFRTVHYMYRIFKEHTGMTTKEYRNRC